MKFKKTHWLIAAAGLFVLYALLGFFLVPRLAKQFMVDQASEQGLKLDLQQVRFNPFTFKAELQQLKLADGEGEPLLSCVHCWADLAVVDSLFGEGWTISEAELSDLAATVGIDANGQLNWVNALPQPEPSQPSQQSAEAPRVIVEKLGLSQGRLDYYEARDNEPFQVSLERIGLQMTGLDTAGEQQAPFDLNLALSSGGSLIASGGYQLSQLSGQSQIKLQDVALSQAWLYRPELVPVVLRDGTLQSEFELKLPGGQSQNVIIEQGHVILDGVSAAYADNSESFTSVGKLEIQGIEVDTASQAIVVEQVDLADSRLTLVKSDDQIDLLSLAGNEDNESIEQSPAAEQDTGWEFTLQSINLQNYQVLFTDNDTELPSEFELTINEAEGGPYAAGQPITLNTRMTLAPQGQIQLQGQYDLESAAGEFEWTTETIELPLAQSYLPQDVMTLESGELSGSGKLSLTSSDQTIQADLALAGLRILQPDQTSLAIASVSVSGLDVAIQELSITANRLLLEQPSISYTLAATGAEGQQQEGSDSEEEEVEVTTESEAQLPKIVIGQIEVAAGELAFNDQTVDPAFTTKVSDFAMLLSGLSNDPPTTATVEASASIDGYAPIMIQGTLNPFSDGESVINASTENLELTGLAPYSDRYLGRLIDKGKLNLMLDYKLDNGRLDARNAIILRQIELGGKTDSEDAVSLPLDLALALLRERSGDVKLDLNIQGDLNDPQFSVPGAILRAFLSLIGKIATSPFSILGALLPDGGQDLSAITFLPGQNEISAEEQKKLDGLSKALYERPNIMLEIQGFAGQRDIDAIKQQQLSEQLEQRLEGLAEGEDPLTAEYIAVLGEPPVEADQATLRTALLDQIQVDSEQLAELAKQRGEYVRSRLLEMQPELADSVFMLAPKVEQNQRSEASGVQLGLKPG